MDEMKGWIDTTAGQQNVWLVLVIHGVDGIGWQPMTSADMDAYFSYIAANKDLWVATFGDVARYVEERMNATVSAHKRGSDIVVFLDHPLDKALFDLPLTLKTAVDPAWQEVTVTQGDAQTVVPVLRDGESAWATYQAQPGNMEVVLSGK